MLHLPILTFASYGWHWCGRKYSPDPKHLISSAFLLVGRFTLQCLFCPFWHFSPYWLGVKVLCRNAWCHIFLVIHLILTVLYFNVMLASVCHCLSTEYQFCRRMDNSLLEINFVCLTSDSLTTDDGI